MPKDELSQTTKGLLGAAGIGSGLAAKKIYDRKNRKKTSRPRKLAGKAYQSSAGTGSSLDPRARRAEVAAETGGKKHRDRVKSSRIQRRANKARQREGLKPKGSGEARVFRKAGQAASRTAKGSGRAFGIGGAVATMPSTVKNAASASREGGSWMNRFGKFVEKALGAPAGSSGRGATKKELESMFKM